MHKNMCRKQSKKLEMTFSQNNPVYSIIRSYKKFALSEEIPLKQGLKQSLKVFCYESKTTFFLFLYSSLPSLML